MLNQKVEPKATAKSHNKPIKILFNLFFISLQLYHIYDKVKSIMIDENSIFDQVRGNLSLACPDDCTGADLAAVAGIAISNKMKSICVAPNRVAEIWPWLEKTKIKIISRFFIDDAIDDNLMSDLSGNVSASFRDGADGTIVFVAKQYLSKFALEMLSVRDDLFFNKSFSIGVNIDEVDVFDWAELFGLLHILRADSLTLVFNNDTGDKSDFVGRIYAMLNAPRGDWAGVVNFMLGQNVLRIDQVYRLICSMQPDAISRTEFFVENC